MKKNKLTFFSALLSICLLSVLHHPYACAGAFCAKQNTNIKMSFSEAYTLAQNSECTRKVGPLEREHWCNTNSGTWWIKLKANIPGCSPACVVDVVNKSAGINYMCLGALPPENLRTK